MKSFIKIVISLVLGWRIALAYIDPNSGGMLFQLLAVLFGLLSGLLFFFSGHIKLLVARFRRSMRGGLSSDHDSGETEDDHELPPIPDPDIDPDR
mgnify:FL=1